MVHTRLSLTASEASICHSKQKLKFTPKKLKGKKIAKSPLKNKKCKLMFQNELLPPPEGLKYAIDVEKHMAAKVATLNKYEPITDIRALLCEQQLSAFSNSCFGYFMKMPHFKIQNQLIHNLLIRQLKQPNPNELWIGVGGVKMKFGLQEFATVTGLLCVGKSDKMRFSKPENSFISSYFDGASSVSKASVKKVFFSKEWKTDSDAVKTAKLYFLHHFLLTTSADSQIPKGDLDLLDSNGFDQYPWGKEVFKFTLDSLRHNAKTTSKDNYYRLNGFPYALQVWFYECCPYLNGKYCDQNGGSIPRVLNWTCDYHAKFEEIYTTLSLDANDLELKKFSPSTKEVEELQLKELLVKDSIVNTSYTDPSTIFGDDDFVCPVPLSGAASSSIPYKDIKTMQIKMRKLESSQKSLVGEVKSLKSIVNEQRAYFDLELSKLRDIFVMKVVADVEESEKENIEANDDFEMFEENIEKEVEVANEEHEKVYTKENNDGFITDQHILGEVSERIPENVIESEFISDDFSPETMEKLENVLKKIEEDSNVKGKDVVAEIAPEVQIVAREGEVADKVTVSDSADDNVLKVAREVNEVDLRNDTLDSFENALKKSKDVEMKDAGVYKSKVVVFRQRDGTGMNGFGEATPAVPKREVKLPAYLCSPFLRHFGSSSKQSTETKDINSIKDIFSYSCNLFLMVELSCEYGWM